VTKTEFLAWRQRGFKYGRWLDGPTPDEVRALKDAEVTRAYFDGLRAGRRERERATA
jgi:hypothetical protein